ncbi:MAG: class I SAM-dependent methyltransferase [Gammaproteobacteria bacterium]
MERINTEVTFNHADIPWYNPVQLGAQTLQKLGKKAETLNEVLATLKRLESDDYLRYVTAYYENGIKKFGDNWGYCDLLTLLRATASITKPKNYLEIGVRRGRSLAVVASAYPDVNIYGFDLWMQNYAGMENPGPEFVHTEIKKLNHTGQLTLISGDSKQTVPEFLKTNPDLYFDLITVDGDHSEEGARCDLENVIPHLKMGGVILLDDISHPQHEYLETLWDELIGNNKQFVAQKYSELGYGIACGVRRSF